jgi:hypothetical protein
MVGYQAPPTDVHVLVWTGSIRLPCPLLSPGSHHLTLWVDCGVSIVLSRDGFMCLPMYIIPPHVVRLILSRVIIFYIGQPTTRAGSVIVSAIVSEHLLEHIYGIPKLESIAMCPSVATVQFIFFSYTFSCRHYVE